MTEEKNIFSIPWRKKKSDLKQDFSAHKAKSLSSFKNGKRICVFIMLAQPLQEEIMELAEKHNFFNL